MATGVTALSSTGIPTLNAAAAVGPTTTFAATLASAGRLQIAVGRGKAPNNNGLVPVIAPMSATSSGNRLNEGNTSTEEPNTRRKSIPGRTSSNNSNSEDDATKGGKKINQYFPRNSSRRFSFGKKSNSIADLKPKTSLSTAVGKYFPGNQARRFSSGANGASASPPKPKWSAMSPKKSDYVQQQPDSIQQKQQLLPPEHPTATTTTTVAQPQRQKQTEQQSSDKKGTTSKKKHGFIRRFSLTLTNKTATNSVNLPPPPLAAAAQHKSVTFFNKKRSKRVPSRHNMTQEEIQNVWYSRRDYEEFDKTRDYCIFMMEAGQGDLFVHSNEYCTRGLEAKTKVGRNLRNAQKRLGYDAVWEEQENFWAQKEAIEYNMALEDNDIIGSSEFYISKQEKQKLHCLSSSSIAAKLSQIDAQMVWSIANSYRDATAPAMQTAIDRGKQDFLDIQDYIGDTFTALREIYPNFAAGGNNGSRRERQPSSRRTSLSSIEF